MYLQFRLRIQIGLVVPTALPCTVPTTRHLTFAWKHPEVSISATVLPWRYINWTRHKTSVERKNVTKQMSKQGPYWKMEHVQIRIRDVKNTTQVECEVVTAVNFSLLGCDAGQTIRPRPLPNPSFVNYVVPLDAIQSDLTTTSLNNKQLNTPFQRFAITPSTLRKQNTGRSVTWWWWW
jgi:hypothetical protein